MKTVYILLLLIFVGCAKDIVKKNPSNNEVNEVSKLESEFSDEDTRSNPISGLKLISKKSKKYGNQLFVISDSYTEKEVSFYNEEGDKVLSKKTIGTPISLSKLKRGAYTIQIVEGKQSETREITVE